MHPLPDHAEPLLYRLFKSTTNSHYLPYTLHATAQLSRDSMEFTKVPTGDFADAVVESRLKKGRSSTRNAILEIEQSISKTQLSRNKGKGIAGCLRGKSRRARKTCIYLNDAVIFTLRVESILYITLPYNTKMTDDTNRKRTQFVVLIIGESLRRCNYNTLAGMDTERVEILHITYRNTIVVGISYDLVFDLLPAL